MKKMLFANKFKLKQMLMILIFWKIFKMKVICTNNIWLENSKIWFAREMNKILISVRKDNLKS
jgi:uncharacterized membrane protein